MKGLWYPGYLSLRPTLIYSYFRLLFSLPLDRVDSAGVLGEPKSMEKS